jgi:cyclopropane fatty-acyl-phospholipid synthase-like methyltransferase
VRQALLSRGFHPGTLQGFDLTQKMIEGFRQTLRKQAIDAVDVIQADVLHLETLPVNWNNFDLIVSAAMLEYVPRKKLTEALTNLRSRLNEEGSILLFITRRNWLTKPLIGRWWDANLYEAAELRESLLLAGFSTIEFNKFPFPYCHLSLWGYIIEAN